MTVTSVERYDKKRARVFLDYEYAFMLYESELVRYDIYEGGEISRETYDIVMKEAVIRRAKQKALDILKRADKSEYMLRRRLSEAKFPEAAVEAAISYINSYHYLDDERYAVNFYRANSGRKSYREILMLLKQNGVEREVLEKALDQGGEPQDALEAETAAVKKLLARRGIEEGTKLEYKEKCKIMQSLYRKGFSESAIKSGLEGF